MVSIIASCSCNRNSSKIPGILCHLIKYSCFHLFFFFFNYVSVSAEARSVKSVEAELQVDVSCPAWVLGTVLGSWKCWMLLMRHLSSFFSHLLMRCVNWKSRLWLYLFICFPFPTWSYFCAVCWISILPWTSCKLLDIDPLPHPQYILAGLLIQAVKLKFSMLWVPPI